jgi:lipopolysaccharide export system protein LptC
MTPPERSARERMLDGLQRQRPDRAAIGIARRSYTVLLLKRVLPVAAVLLLVALAIAPNLHWGASTDRVVYHVQPGASSTAMSTMQNAQYRGVDQHGQPFTLTANQANEQGTDNVDLAKPEGNITLTSGAWIMLKSDKGVFNQKSQMLGLNGNVMLYRNDGTVMTAPTAAIDLHGGNASSTSPVAAQGPFGTLNAANGFTLINRGADVVFKGPVTLTLNQANPAK